MLFDVECIAIQTLFFFPHCHLLILKKENRTEQMNLMASTKLICHVCLFVFFILVHYQCFMVHKKATCMSEMLQGLCDLIIYIIHIYMAFCCSEKLEDMHNKNLCNLFNEFFSWDFVWCD